MTFPSAKRCCFCLSLQTAGFLMGFVGILLNLTSIYLYIIIKKSNENSTDNTVGIWEILMSCIFLFIDISWIYGIYKKRPKPMLPYLILAFIGVIIFVLAPFGSLFYFSATNAKPVTGSIIFLMLCCLGGLAYYLWIVQYSLYIMIKKSATNKDEESDGL